MKYFLDLLDDPECGLQTRIPNDQFEVLMQSMTTLMNIKSEIMSSCAASQSELMLMSYALDYKHEHGEPITTHTIAKLTGASPPAVSRSLKALSAKGCIERVTDQKDRRSVRVEITALGEEKVRGFLSGILKTMNRAFDGFTDEELIRTIQLQQRFVNAIIDQLKEERGRKQ